MGSRQSPRSPGCQPRLLRLAGDLPTETNRSQQRCARGFEKAVWADSSPHFVRDRNDMLFLFSVDLFFRDWRVFLSSMQRFAEPAQQGPMSSRRTFFVRRDLPTETYQSRQRCARGFEKAVWADSSPHFARDRNDMLFLFSVDLFFRDWRVSLSSMQGLLSQPNKDPCHPERPSKI